MDGLTGLDTQMRKYPVWPMGQTNPKEFYPGQGGQASIFQGPVSSLDPLGGIFGGEGAATKSPGMLKEARRLMKMLKGSAKKVSEKVRKKTGWFKGIDDKWRFEIDDSAFNLKKRHGKTFVDSFAIDSSGVYKLEDVVEHPEMFEAYPELKNMTLTIKKGDFAQQGSFGDKGITMQAAKSRYGKDVEPWKETLIHEIQHAVQETEGFAKGGSPSQFSQVKEAELARDAMTFRREIDKLPKGMDISAKENTIVKQYQDMDAMDWLPSREARNLAFDRNNNPDSQLNELITAYGLDKRVSADPHKMYRSLAGEIESRDAANRMDFGPLQRTGTRPDIDRPDAIVQYGLKGEAGQVGPVKQANENLRGKRHEFENINFSRIEELGTTTDIREAGYISPDGSLVDLSGKREGGDPGTRSFDHREAGGTIGMQEFGALGHIRMDENSGMIDIYKEPTSKQYSMISELAQRKGGEIVVELQNGLGKLLSDYYQNAEGIFDREYPKGTKPRKIINDIKQFYAGNKPQAGRRGYAEGAKLFGLLGAGILGAEMAESATEN